MGFNRRVTHEMMDFFGYAHAASIYAIVELVCYCISIVGIIFIFIPICGIRLTKFDEGSYCCVGAIVSVHL